MLRAARERFIRLVLVVVAWVLRAERHALRPFAVHCADSAMRALEAALSRN